MAVMPRSRPGSRDQSRHTLLRHEASRDALAPHHLDDWPHRAPGRSVGAAAKASASHHAANPAERRRQLRWPVFWGATLSDGRRSETCVVLDFSPTGAKLRSALREPAGTLVTLDFPGAIQLVGTLVWQRGGMQGIAFSKDQSQPVDLAAQGIAA